MDVQEKRSFEWVIGQKVKIKTIFNEEYTADIWSYDSTSNCVVLSHIQLNIYSISIP